MTIDEQRILQIRYLVMKVEQEDWHGVADAAMDLRDIDAELKGRRSVSDVEPCQDH